MKLSDDDVVGEICTDDYAINGCGCGCVPRDIEVKVSHLNQDARTTLLRGQAERDLSPEEAQLEVTKRFGQGSSVQVDFEVNSDWTWTKRVTLFDWESNEISEAETFREAFANADKAEAEREKK